MTTLTNNYARKVANGDTNAEEYRFDFSLGWDEDCNSKIINQAVALAANEIKVRT